MILARSCWCFGGLMVIGASNVGAQNPSYPPQPTSAPSAPGAPPSGRVMRASRATGPINIDGKLNEPSWAAAVPSGDFTQSYPKVGAKPTDPTEVRVLYDDDALYVGVRMFDARPDSIAAQLARRDVTGIYSDWLHVMVDSYRDRRRRSGRHADCPRSAGIALPQREASAGSRRARESFLSL